MNATQMLESLIADIPNISGEEYRARRQQIYNQIHEEAKAKHAESNHNEISCSFCAEERLAEMDNAPLIRVVGGKKREFRKGIMV